MTTNTLVNDIENIVVAASSGSVDLERLRPPAAPCRRRDSPPSC